MLLSIFMAAWMAQALELKTQSFYFCSRKTAKGPLVRTLRIHQLDNKCLVFYSTKGKDQLISSGRWMAFCKSKRDQVINNLQKGSWICKKEEGAEFFYSSF